MGHIINIPQIFRCHVIAIQLIPSDQLILVYLKPHRVLENYVILLVHTTFSRNFGRIKKVPDHLFYFRKNIYSGCTIPSRLFSGPSQ